MAYFIVLWWPHVFVPKSSLGKNEFSLNSQYLVETRETVPSRLKSPEPKKRFSFTFPPSQKNNPGKSFLKVLGSLVFLLKGYYIHIHRFYTQNHTYTHTHLMLHLLDRLSALLIFISYLWSPLLYQLSSSTSTSIAYIGASENCKKYFMSSHKNTYLNRMCCIS